MTDAAAVAAVFDRVARSYETVGPPFFDHFGARLVARAGVRLGDRVLDLAAGMSWQAHLAVGMCRDP